MIASKRVELCVLPAHPTQVASGGGASASENSWDRWQFVGQCVTSVSPAARDDGRRCGFAAEAFINEQLFLFHAPEGSQGACPARCFPSRHGAGRIGKRTRQNSALDSNPLTSEAGWKEVESRIRSIGGRGGRAETRPLLERLSWSL